MLHDRMQLVRNRVQEFIERANILYGITLPHVDIEFDLRGTSAGQASATGTALHRKYLIRFNKDMMQNSGWDHLYSETLPHELAHIICFFRNIDNGHGTNWKRVCRTLGGNAERCHTQEVVYARGKTYEYTTSTGHTVRLSEIRHRKIQQNRISFSSPNVGKIDHTCMFTIVN